MYILHISVSYKNKEYLHFILWVQGIMSELSMLYACQTKLKIHIVNMINH